MPQLDLYHDQVKRALLKDGWVITDDPFRIEYKGARLYADLAAEKPIAAQKDEQKIVVEIKVFITPSPMTELERAVGQYAIYRLLLIGLVWSVNYSWQSRRIYQDFFLKPAVQDIVTDHRICLLVFDPESEEVVQWIR